MIILEDILSQEIVQRLGWTLLHFIWQAAAVAFILAILLRLLRKSTANLRYIIACLALAMIVMLPVITIRSVPVATTPPAIHITPATAPTLMPAVELPAHETIVIAEPSRSESANVVASISFKQRVADTLEPALPYIVSVWLIGVFGLSIWHLGGWTQLHRLKRRMVKQVDSTLLNKLKALTQNLKIKQKVQLMESAIVQIPTVVGWLRPVILLPASALSGLNTEQLEAIIAHELAHIRRFDYLINILQTVVEILGFYHPAVWWVSYKIRAERENCCDDMAVSISGDRLSYAGALASMEEIRAGQRKLAIAASGGNLFRRICRLLGKDSNDNTGLSWVPAVTAILLIIALAIPTTLALTKKADSMPNEPQAELQVKNDIIATSQDEKSPSGKILFKLVDTNSRPIVGAWVGTFVDWSDVAENPPVWFLNDGGSYKASKIESAAKIISNDEGKIILTEEELFEPQWSAERKVPITAIDEGHYLAGLQELSRDDLGTEVTLMLKPGCRVHGRVSAATARKRKWSTNILTVYVHWQEHRPCQYTSKQGRFEFVLPPGKYKVKVYSEDPDKVMILPILIKPGQRDLDLTEYLDGEKKLPSQKNYIQVEDDIIATSQNEESPAGNIPPTTLLAISPAPPDEDKVHVVKANCLVVEVPLDSKIDTETLKEADNILGNKINLRNTKVDDILRQAAKGTTVAEDKSAENKRITEKQFNALVKMLDSKGYLKILMNPMIETLNGKTATIRSTQHVPLQQMTKALPGGGGQLNKATKEIQYVDVVDLIEITPHVHADGHIILDVEADFGLQDIPLYEEPGPVSLRQFSSRMSASPGESLIVGGLVDNSPAPGDNINNPEKPAKELLFIITPTIMIPPENLKEITDKQIEGFKRELSTQNLKKLGLAVAMFAEYHDDNLPESIQELRPWIRGQQNFDWLRDNIEYFDKGKTAQRNAAFIPIAYDRTLLDKADGTNVLFLDFSVRFVDTKEFEKLDLKRAEFLIEAWILEVSKDFIQNINYNADSPDEAKELLELKPILLAAVDGPNKLSFMPPEHNVNLFLKAVRANKDSTVLAHPQVLAREGKTAKISCMSNEFYYPAGYTEPNNPSEKSEPKLEKIEEGISLSFKPKLTEDKNIDMQFESVISRFLDFDERKLKGEGPKVERRAQSSRYRVENGQTLLFGSNEIADHQDEQSELLVLITAHIIGPSEQDKPAQAKPPAIVEPTSSTTQVITPPTIAKSNTERPEDSKQEKTKTVAEQKSQVVQKLFKLKYQDASQIARVLRPLLTNTGHISTDERTNTLIVIDTVENLVRIEKAVAQFDVAKADETVTEVFEIRYGDPVEIVDLLKKLINGRPGNGAIIEQGKEPIVLVPEPKRKWIIAKASPENIKQIGQWIEKLDTSKTTIGLDPIDIAVYEQLETIVDLSDLAPQMSFGEVIDRLKVSVDPPLQIQPIWKDLLENAEVEQATPAGMDPLTRVKLRKALEILLTSVSSTGLPKPTYVVDEGVILIGTEKTLPPKMGSHVYDTSDLLGTDATKASPENMPKIAEQIKEWDVPLDVNRIKPRIIELQNSDAEQMVELLKTLFTKGGGGGLNIQDILIDRGIKVKQKIVGPPHKQLTFEVVPGTKKLIIISKIPEAYDVIEEFIFDLDRQNVSPENIKQIVQSGNKLDTEKTIGMDPIDAAVYEQLETIVDLSDLNPRTSFGKVIEKLENSVSPPLQIQPIWKDLLENAEVEQATPAEMDPLTGIKLRKALEILLASITTSQLGESAKPTYIVDNGVIVIGTAGMLPQKLWIEKLDTSKTTTGLDPINVAVYEQLETIVDLSDLAPGMSFSEVIERLENSVEPPVQIQPIWKDLLENAEVEQATPAGMDPLPHIKLRKALEILLTSVSSTGLPKPTYVVDEGVILIGTAEVLPPKLDDILSSPDEPREPNLPSITTVPLEDSMTHSEQIQKQLDELIKQQKPKEDSAPSEIMIETQLWSVTEDFLKDVGLAANFEDISDDWRGHLAATYPAGPNGKPYGLIIDDLHVNFLLRTLQAHHDSKVLIAPRVLTREGKTAEIGILTEEYNCITGYDEPQDLSEEPQPKRDKVEIGTRIWVTPKLTEDNRNINLDLKLEITQLKGIIEGKYKEKYPIYKPIIDVISTTMLCTIPDGKTTLIGGLKINEQTTKEPGTPGLKDLPLIGAVFSGKDKTAEQKMLLILVKPIINPEQKATKILPGEEGSEEDIRRLAEQLDKKIKSSAN